MQYEDDEETVICTPRRLGLQRLVVKATGRTACSSRRRAQDADAPRVSARKWKHRLAEAKDDDLSHVLEAFEPTSVTCVLTS